MAAQQVDTFFQNDHGAGAVDVVIAIKQNGLVLFDGAAQALDGRVHIFEQLGS